MTTPNGLPIPPPATGERAPATGDRPPAGRPSRPPSARYGSGRLEDAPAPTSDVPRSAFRALAPAIIAAIATAAVLILVGGVLEERRGLLALAGIGGAVAGLLAAEAASAADGSVPAVMSRGRARQIAVGLALSMIATSAIGIWAYGRLQGRVMDPVSYLWATLGLFVPAQAVIAGVAAAWGAGAGPIRWRQ